ncbi:signal peptidase II [Aquipuribacter hungaricus]|uniref:signal peptidase II n=1 Tax=Aquipuribacter hungaricus TaxID=545624 RepID=UPI0030EBA910
MLAADQVTKRLAERGLERGVRVDVLGDVLGFRLFYNSGAAFSLGTGITPVLSVFACLAVVAILVALTRSGSLRWSLALGALLGGALGNLTDRLLRPPGPFRGEVVDFIEIPFSFPIFNVADMAVVAGAVSIVLLSLVGQELGGGRAPARADAGTGSGSGAAADARAPRPTDPPRDS